MTEEGRDPVDDAGKGPQEAVEQDVPDVTADPTIRTLIPMNGAPEPPPVLAPPIAMAAAATTGEPVPEPAVESVESPAEPAVEPVESPAEPAVDAVEEPVVDAPDGAPEAEVATEPVTEVLPPTVAAVEAVEAETPQSPPVAPPATHKAARRRRWPWVVLASVLALLVLAAGAVVWYFSGLIGANMAIDQAGTPFPLTVLTADGGKITYSQGSSEEDELPLMGVATINGGYVQTSDPVTVGSGSVATTSRAIDKQVLAPPPATNEAATLDAWFFPRDPKVGLGVDYETVTYDAPGGPTPAWFIPGTSDTWVIFTHGRAVTPREGLRIASTVTKLGYPMLLITYRDDAGAPAEDALGNFGQTEAPDLEAAVQYALDNGAKRVVLAGASMGAAISLAFLQQSALAPSVVGAFFDSPATDYGRMVSNGAADMGVPDFVTSAAKQVASWRYGVDWSAVDYISQASSLTIPMLIVQGAEDTKVPASVNEEFVSATRPGLVQWEVFPGAGHVQAWNVDRARYDALLTDFLTKVAPTSAS